MRERRDDTYECGLLHTNMIGPQLISHIGPHERLYVTKSHQRRSPNDFVTTWNKSLKENPLRDHANGEKPFFGPLVLQNHRAVVSLLHPRYDKIAKQTRKANNIR